MSEVKTKVGVKRVFPELSSTALLYSPFHTCAVFPISVTDDPHMRRNPGFREPPDRLGSRQISIYSVEMFWRQEQVSSTVSRPSAVSTCTVPNDMRQSTPRRVMCRTCLECVPLSEHQSGELRVASE